MIKKALLIFFLLSYFYLPAGAMQSLSERESGKITQLSFLASDIHVHSLKDPQALQAFFQATKNNQLPIPVIMHTAYSYIFNPTFSIEQKKSFMHRFIKLAQEKMLQKTGISNGWWSQTIEVMSFMLDVIENYKAVIAQDPKYYNLTINVSFPIRKEEKEAHVNELARKFLYPSQLLKYVGDIESKFENTNVSLLFLAIAKNKPKIVQLLLERGAKIDTSGMKPGFIISYTAQKGYNDVFNHLLKDASFDITNAVIGHSVFYNPLYISVVKDNEEMVKRLLPLYVAKDKKIGQSIINYVYPKQDVSEIVDELKEKKNNQHGALKKVTEKKIAIVDGYFGQNRTLLDYLLKEKKFSGSAKKGVLEKYIQLLQKNGAKTFH